jgi:hypothetical protein
MPVLRPILARQDPKAWALGYRYGLDGKPSWPPPEGFGGFGWSSGYIEGQAKRERPSAQRRKF